MIMASFSPQNAPNILLRSHSDLTQRQSSAESFKDKKSSKGSNTDISSSTTAPLKKPRKSISWSQLLLPSYKYRYDEFRKHFQKHVPTSERLLCDFSCALQREILIHGRLYVSQNYLSFHANIFGWETVVVIKLSDVTALTKANTIRVIPNAIQIITTNGSKYTFTSFVARDRAFKRVYRVWQDTVIGPKMSIAELWELIHYNYGADLGVPSDGEDECDAPLGDKTLLNDAKITREVSGDDDDDVFNDHNYPIKNKTQTIDSHDSIASFLTCPEPEDNDFIDDEFHSFPPEGVSIDNPKSNNEHYLNHYQSFYSKIKLWFLSYRFLSRESIYIRLLLILSLLILIMHLILLYKLSQIDVSYVNSMTKHNNLDQLQQLADTASRLIRDANSRE